MVAASLQKSSRTSRPTSFNHEPLDYRRGAIRLLRILPLLSADGLIQCEIWHDSVEASYTCLSYVWGSEKIQRQILVNGKLFLVRENLYDFMRVAQSKYANPARAFWIDALCIDQDSVHEKNHQVAQMGPIYANAVEVFSWLGLSQTIGRAFTFGLQLGVDVDMYSFDIRAPTWEDLHQKWIERNNQTHGQLAKDWLTVVRDRYWTRAWITQEILLARQVKLLVNDLEIDPIQISSCASGRPRYINDLKRNLWSDHEKWDTETQVFSCYFGWICGRRELRFQEKKLINFFDSVPGRQSYYVHDRVYSLLSLASDTSSIKVDYRISPSDLLRQVMNLYKKNMCICAWFFMANMMDCYHVPNDKSRDGGAGRSPIFRLPMKPVQTDFIMSAANSKNWHNACSECGMKMPHFEKQVHTTFCIQSLCENIRPGHLYVYKNKHGNYEISRKGDTTSYEVVHFQPGNPGSRDDIDLGWGSMPGLYDAYLTGDVLMKLFLYPERSVRQTLPMEICRRAQGHSANMEFC